MEQQLSIVAVAFFGGWVARDLVWSHPKADPQVCTCNCNCRCIGELGESSWTTSNFFLVSLLVIGLCIAFSQTALALRVSFKDGSTGSDRVLSVDVKGAGKSKGVFGAAKGLQLVG